MSTMRASVHVYSYTAPTSEYSYTVAHRIMERLYARTQESTRARGDRRTLTWPRHHLCQPGLPSSKKKILRTKQGHAAMEWNLASFSKIAYSREAMALFSFYFFILGIVVFLFLFANYI